MQIQEILPLLAAIATTIAAALVIFGKIYRFSQITQTVEHIEKDIKDHIKPELKELRADVNILKTKVAVIDQKLDMILDILKLKPKIKKP